MTDTEAPMLARYLGLIRKMPKPERLVRAVALSAFARDMAWQGATQRSGHLGVHAVTERFLLQLYGPDVAGQIVSLLHASSDASADNE